MKKPKSMENWGRAAAKKRYAEGGQVTGDELLQYHRPMDNYETGKLRDQYKTLSSVPNGTQEQMSQDMSTASQISRRVPRRK